MRCAHGRVANVVPAAAQCKRCQWWPKMTLPISNLVKWPQASAGPGLHQSAGAPLQCHSGTPSATQGEPVPLRDTLCGQGNVRLQAVTAAQAGAGAKTSSQGLLLGYPSISSSEGTWTGVTQSCPMPTLGWVCEKPPPPPPTRPWHWCQGDSKLLQDQNCTVSITCRDTGDTLGHPRWHPAQPCPTPTPRAGAVGNLHPQQLKRQGWERVRSAAVRYGAR